jgi:hypothetical protein
MPAGEFPRRVVAVTGAASSLVGPVLEEPYGPRPHAARAIRKRADGDGDLARVVGAIARGDFRRRMSASSTRGSARRSAKENLALVLL